MIALSMENNLLNLNVNLFYQIKANFVVPQHNGFVGEALIFVILATKDNVEVLYIINILQENIYQICQKINYQNA